MTPDIRTMFGRVAPRYDLLNSVISLGLHGLWKRRAARQLLSSRKDGGFLIDIGCGSGDLLEELARNGADAAGLDFCPGMLQEARRRRVRSPLLQADARFLPLSDGSADGAVSAFVMRNIPELDKALREALRVLKPGARLVILEFSLPPSRLIRILFQVYMRIFFPPVCWLFGSDPAAYRYLGDSIFAFGASVDLAAEMRAAGFCAVTRRPLMLGTVSIWDGQKP